MSTLLIRLAAPLQSWGAESKFDIRRTKREPTKSGIIGLFAAALGRHRNEGIEDLSSLRFGVRVDKEGELLRDYQMVEAKQPYQTYRYYLSDAVFLAGVESPDEEFLLELDKALRHPAYPLFLGRRSCPPTQPLSLGIRCTELEEALYEEPWQTSEIFQARYNGNGKKAKVSLRMVLDAKEQEKCIVERDFPVSYDSRYRQYGYRAVTERNVVKILNDYSTEHDPMKEFGG